MTRDNNTLHTEPRAARLFLLACLSPRPGERCRYPFPNTMKLDLQMTSWIANPNRCFDYIHSLVFDDEWGFIEQGDGQSVNWASLFTYKFDGELLKIKFVPTESLWIESDYNGSVETHVSRELGRIEFQNATNSKLEFSEWIMLSDSILGYEEPSPTYYRVSHCDFERATHGYDVKRSGSGYG